jgi:hypothetical protein
MAYLHGFMRDVQLSRTWNVASHTMRFRRCRNELSLQVAQIVLVVAVYECGSSGLSQEFLVGIDCFRS